MSGDYIYNSKNARDCYRVHGSEDVKFCQNVLSGTLKDSYDYTNWGENAELMYECLICGKGNSGLKFCAQCYPGNRDLEYCVFCQNSYDLFGCVGLKNKKYCIFNKQYSKEEYEELVPKIRKHMNEMPYRDRVGNTFVYGEFFPPELSPFPYHISEAQELFPLMEKEALARGFLWYPIQKDEYAADFPAAQIPDRIMDMDDSILQKIIACEHNGECQQECTKAFRIIKQELEFCRRLNIPLPRLCPNCRHYERLAFRNPPRFFERACGCSGKASENGVYANTIDHFHGAEHCPNQFETSYAPDRPEIVYCEQCYQTEVV